MTAEALATRILIGDKISKEAIEEAEAYLMLNLPGNGQDNYYYWYYATIGLHQLQTRTGISGTRLCVKTSHHSNLMAVGKPKRFGAVYGGKSTPLQIQRYAWRPIPTHVEIIGSESQQPNQPLRR